MFKKVIIPDKGYGFVATQFIPKDTIIFRENPTFELENDNPVSECLELIYTILIDSDQEKIDNFKLLVPTDLENYEVNRNDLLSELEFLKKHGKTHHMYKFLTENYTLDELSLFVAKYACNCFEFEYKPIILLQSTYFNHSCYPNVIFGCYVKNFVREMIFYTCRDINKNEELTINYIDICVNRKARMDKLLNNYGFTCTCERCSEIHHDKIKEYDKFARDLEKLRKEFSEVVL